MLTNAVIFLNLPDWTWAVSSGSSLTLAVNVIPIG